MLNAVTCVPLEGQRIAALDSDNELCKMQSLFSTTFLNGASAGPRPPCSSCAAHPEPSQEPPAAHTDTPGPPAPREPLGVHSKQGSQRCIWARSQENLCGVPQRSAEERPVREFSPQPSIEFPTRANQEARKKLIRGDNNVPKCCVNVLKLNIHSKVN